MRRGILEATRDRVGIMGDATGYLIYSILHLLADPIGWIALAAFGGVWLWHRRFRS
jgi:hypothetical protein